MNFLAKALKPVYFHSSSKIYLLNNGSYVILKKNSYDERDFKLNIINEQWDIINSRDKDYFCILKEINDELADLYEMGYRYEEI